ncbi:tRNA (mnm(5)s(2)U34)-methyltransferase [Enterococcus songbeiensis]|uniref:tRNA (mnm(5)s(2)U34)-methyltransferase n=1 Tax=Enterococcus songbeiensis TaxID=2559927 RepID=UPI0010F8A7E0|nr:class I SAM-dependent methyltransferase [Enterococcus songbeiensis]
MLSALRFSHQLVKEILQPGDYAVDATMGNGNDTLFLAQLVGETGKVYAFDIQEAAVIATKKKLADNQLTSRTELILDGHQHVEKYLAAPIKAAIFNLGYLPNSDKSVITLPDTTKSAFDQLLRFLLPHGRLIIVAYYGHAGGQEELTAVDEYCQQLPQEDYSVLRYQFINQKNQPPILFCIEKK